MLPDIPTTAEAGVPGLELVSWYAVYAPAGTPQPIVDKLAAAMEKIATSADYKQKILEQGAYATFMGPKELGEFTKAELVYWGRSSRRPASPSTSDEACADHDQTAGAPRSWVRRPPLGFCHGKRSRQLDPRTQVTRWTAHPPTVEVRGPPD